MITKRYIIAALAFLGLAGNVSADTTKLLEADGWTKITTLPTASEIANNYYVFVDNSQDLMLTISKGSHNNGKWYSLSLWYQTSVEPTTSAILSKLWILQKGSYGDGSYALQNVEYPARLIQTEYNKAYLMETNDVSSPNDWSKLNFAYADGYWTIENGQYPASSSANYKGHLGPWDEVNTNTNIQNGQELAGNKSGNYIGHFLIYTITRTKFKENYLAAASSANPVDISFINVTNPTLDLNIDGWTRSATSLGGNAASNYCTETWHSSTDFKFYQTVSNLPEGAYQVSVQARSQTNSGAVYATVGTTTVSTPVNTTTSSTSMQTEATTMLDRTTGKITTPSISLDEGQTLTMGFMDNVADQWDVFDNFKLYYLGNDLSVYAAARDAVKTAAEEAIASNLVPDACETAIQTAINNNSGDYSTKAEYIAAQNAIQTALDTYFTSEIKSAYAAYYAFKAKAEGLKTGVDDGSTKTTFTNAISTATTAVEAATTTSAINTQKANVRSAAITFISNTDGQFDITFLASQNYSDWKKKDGSNAGIVADQFLSNRPNTIPSFAESFEWTAATTGMVLYQTVSDLPAGYYQVGMYAMALSTSQRDTGITTEATEGDANRSFAFAGDQRTGLPIKFATAINFDDLTTLDVNVHLSSTGNLTFGVQKDANGSNWHFAQIASIIYSNAPDLTNLIATRDALVAEAEGLLSGSSDYLTTAQRSALQDAIDDGNDANDFDALNTVTLTTLPNAINTAKQQIQLVKDNRVLMIAALERFENDYNLADGTDYRRSTMSAEAWAMLITKVNAVSTALDDVSQAANYGTLKDALIAQMDATDGSLRLFKSYKAMSEGVRSFSEGGQVVGGTAADSEMDSDDTEQTAITSLNTAFVSYANAQAANFAVPAFLGENLDFSAAEGATLNSDNSNTICEVTGWEVNYADADTWAVLQTHQIDNAEKLYIRKNWGSSATTLTTTKQKMLPVGKYRLSLSWNSNLENMTNLSCYKLGSTTTAIGQATSGAETLTYDFEVTEQPTAFDLVLGFQKQNKDNTPAQLIVDDITLTYQKFDSDNHCDVFAITDGQPVTIAEAFTAATVTNTRTLAQDDDAYTVCLPYALSSNADRQFYELKSSTSETLRFQEVTQTEPLKPYLVIAKNTTSLNAENVEVAATTSFDGGAVTAGDFQMKGTLSGISRSEAETLGAYILQSGNKWSQVTSESSASAKIPAYRAYIVATNPGARLLFSSFDDETTGISEAGRQPVRAEFYDLNGRLVGSMPIGKGIYVSGGKKIMKK